MIAEHAASRKRPLPARRGRRARPASKSARPDSNSLCCDGTLVIAQPALIRRLPGLADGFLDRLIDGVHQFGVVGLPADEVLDEHVTGQLALQVSQLVFVVRLYRLLRRLEVLYQPADGASLRKETTRLSDRKPEAYLLIYDGKTAYSITFSE